MKYLLPIVTLGLLALAACSSNDDSAPGNFVLNEPKGPTGQFTAFPEGTDVPSKNALCDEAAGFPQLDPSLKVGQEFISTSSSSTTRGEMGGSFPYHSHIDEIDPAGLTGDTFKCCGRASASDRLVM